MRFTMPQPRCRAPTSLRASSAAVRSSSSCCSRLSRSPARAPAFGLQVVCRDTLCISTTVHRQCLPFCCAAVPSSSAPEAHFKPRPHPTHRSASSTRRSSLAAARCFSAAASAASARCASSVRSACCCGARHTETGFGHHNAMATQHLLGAGLADNSFQFTQHDELSGQVHRCASPGAPAPGPSAAPPGACAPAPAPPPGWPPAAARLTAGPTAPAPPPGPEGRWAAACADSRAEQTCSCP